MLNLSIQTDMTICDCLHEWVSKNLVVLAKLMSLYLQGYLVGNGLTDRQFDGNALVPFAHGMGLISDDIFEVEEC